MTSTREVVDDLLRRIGSGDPDQIAAACADRVDWQLDWPEHWHGGPVPWVRHRSSRAEVAEGEGGSAETVRQLVRSTCPTTRWIPWQRLGPVWTTPPMW